MVRGGVRVPLARRRCWQERCVAPCAQVRAVEAQCACSASLRHVSKRCSRCACFFDSRPWQTRVERFNYEINMRVLVPIRRLINVLEKRGQLDKYISAHVYAFSTLMQPLLQHGLDLLRAAWNNHNVSLVRHVKDSGGIPDERAARRPHPGGQLLLPRGVDGVREYELARGHDLEHKSRDDVADDEFCARPGARSRAVAAIVGDVERAWCELLDRSYSRSIDAYLCFLSYYD